MIREKTTVLLLSSIILLSSVCLADPAIADSGAGRAIIDRINEVVCLLITLILYVAGGITALAIILGGLKYMTSDNPEETSRAKTMIVYAVIGLIVAVIACPVVDYTVTNTEILPFQKSCDCALGGGGGTTTTTISGPCTDGTSVGQCSVANPGMRCVLNPSTGNPVLVSDPTCTGTTTSAPIGTTSSVTTTSTFPCPNADCPDDAATCQGASDLGTCNDVGGLPGLDSVCGTGYRQCCCDKHGLCC